MEPLLGTKLLQVEHEVEDQEDQPQKKIVEAKKPQMERLTENEQQIEEG